MQITYAKKPMLQDVSGQAQEFMRYYYPIDLGKHQAPPLWTSNQHLESISGFQPPTPMPVPNYPQLPSLGVNELIYPSGATRWTKTFLLTDGDTVSDLIVSHGKKGRPADLIINDGDQRLRFAEMYMLRPIKVGTARVNPLYVLPLVDVRYWWNLKVVNAVVESAQAWDQYVSALSPRSGQIKTLPLSVDTAWMGPDQLEFDRSDLSLAVHMEATAWSIGRRFVPKWSIGDSNQEYVLIDYEEAKKQIKINEKQSGFTGERRDLPEHKRTDLIGGGLVSRVALPYQVNVVFRKWVDYQPLKDSRDLYSKTIDAPSTIRAQSWEIPGEQPTFTILSSMPAHFTESEFDSDPTTPSNQADVDALAELIGEAYYDWNSRQYRKAVYAGLVRWDLTGLEDYVHWRFTADETVTRIADLPDDCYVTTSVNSDTTSAEYTRIRNMSTWAKWIKFSLDSALTTSDATVNGTLEAYWDGDPPDDPMVLRNLQNEAATAYVFEGSTNDVGYAIFDPVLGVAGEYRIVQLEC